MIIIVSYLKVLIKRSTHLPLTERITRWLEGDYKKLYVTGNQLDEALVPHIDVICRISQEKDNA